MFTYLRRVQEPYAFLALHGCLGLCKQLAGQLHMLVPELVPALAPVLRRREPTTATKACLVLAQMLRGDARCCKALLPHLPQLGPSLKLMYSVHADVDLGYNSRRVTTVHDCVDLVLQLLVAGAGKRAEAAAKRHVPTFCCTGV